MRTGGISWIAVVATLLGLALISPQQAAAASLDADTALSTTNTPIPLEGGTQNVAMQATNGTWAGYWDFGDKNGDGVRDDAVSPSGLVMGDYYLRHTTISGSGCQNIFLNLNGGDLIATNGYLQTQARYTVGGIAIANVSNVSMGNGYMLITNVPGYSITSLGDLRIGEDGSTGPVAGHVQVAGIKRPAYGEGTGGVFIYGSGDVLIQDGGDPAVGKDLIVGGTDDVPPTAGTGQAAWSRLVVFHRGSFRAANVYGIIKGYQGDANTSDEKAILFDGWYLGTGAPTGEFRADRLDTQGIERTGATKTLNAPSVVIGNYGSVTIGDVVTRAWDGGGSGNNSGTSGSLTVTNIQGSITITGDINFDAETAGTSKDGDLVLSAGGIITLSSLDMSHIKTVSLSPGSEGLISGLITGTNGVALAGSGGVLTNAGTDFRVPSGRIIRYRPAQNPDLGGGTYVLADLAGAAGSGGTLAPQVVFQGTVFRFR